jgi:hypothetical protein
MTGARSLVLFGALSCAVLLAACGSGHGGTASASSSSGLAISQCMRAHGVPNFPDPSKGPEGSEGMTVTMTPGSSTVTVDGIPFSGPAFESAEKTCKLFGGGTAPPQISESQRVAAFDFARCMRTNGVPNFPDPVFGAGGGIGSPKAQVSRDSPAVKRAAAICNKR